MYAVAALIVISVFCGLIFSYIVVVISDSAPATKALDNISITNITLEPNSTNPLINFRGFTLGHGYLEITNTGDQNLTLTLTMSALVNSTNTLYVPNINQYAGSAIIPNITINAHSSRIISATAIDTAPPFHYTGWNQKPSGYWSYSCAVQASIPISYLFWHTTVGCKTFDFTGSEIILG
jgi:hypothetical protein